LPSRRLHADVGAAIAVTRRSRGRLAAHRRHYQDTVTKAMEILDHPIAWLVTGVSAGFVIGWLLARLSRLGHTRAARRDAVRRSAAVTAGKVFEQLVPWLPDFAFDPRDARFLGSPVDFIVFDGLSTGDVRRVVFVEVKTGEADLSTRERRVREAILRGRVEWAEHRVDRNGRSTT
jgi:hypothetical protein